VLAAKEGILFGNENVTVQNARKVWENQSNF